MGILDEAIREHLELKRQHGATESELQDLEKDAFGPAERPGAEGADQVSEAPTEFMTQPGPEASPEEAVSEPSPREEAATRIAGLQEPPEAPGDAEVPERAESEGSEQLKDEAPEEPEGEEEPDLSASGPSTEERQVIAEQPTEHFDVVAAGEADEPESVQVDEEDDFFDEQRLSEELDQALEGPSDVSRETTAPDEAAPTPDEEPEAPEPAAEAPAEVAEETASDAGQSASEKEDVLEETPEFLEESPEDDELWFEQKPPKDFDFDD